MSAIQKKIDAVMGEIRFRDRLESDINKLNPHQKFLLSMFVSSPLEKLFDDQENYVTILMSAGSKNRETISKYLTYQHINFLAIRAKLFDIPVPKITKEDLQKYAETSLASLPSSDLSLLRSYVQLNMDTLKNKRYQMNRLSNTYIRDNNILRKQTSGRVTGMPYYSLAFPNRNPTKDFYGQARLYELAGVIKELGMDIPKRGGKTRKRHAKKLTKKSRTQK